MSRIAIIGNAGGGKSTLARKIAERRRLPHIEVDSLLWQPGWKLVPEEIYTREHDRVIAQENWVIDGLGRQNSLQARLARATELILIDMPLWMHFWLAADRQAAWARGEIEHAPAGMAERPPTRDLFHTIWEVDQTWLPRLRILCREAEEGGTKVIRLESVEELDAFAATLDHPLAPK